MKLLESNIVFVVGCSNSGKTTVIKKLIESLIDFKIGNIKFIHHKGLSFDKTGKDTHNYRKSGSLFSIAVAPTETAILVSKNKRDDLNSIIDYLKLQSQLLPEVDLIFCEGYNSPPENSPVILCGINEKDLQLFIEKLNNKSIIAISGKIAVRMKKWNQTPIKNIQNTNDLEYLRNWIITYLNKDL